MDIKGKSLFQGDKIMNYLKPIIFLITIFLLAGCSSNNSPINEGLLSTIVSFEDNDGLSSTLIFPKASSRLHNDWNRFDNIKFYKAKSIKSYYKIDDNKNEIVQIPLDNINQENKDNIYELNIYLLIGEGEVPFHKKTISKFLLSSFEWNKRPPLNINGRQGFTLGYNGDFALLTNSDFSIIHYDKLDDFSTHSYIGIGIVGHVIGWEYDLRNNKFPESGTFSVQIFQTEKIKKIGEAIAQYSFFISDKEDNNNIGFIFDNSSYKIKTTNDKNVESIYTYLDL